MTQQLQEKCQGEDTPHEVVYFSAVLLCHHRNRPKSCYLSSSGTASPCLCGALWGLKCFAFWISPELSRGRQCICIKGVLSLCWLPFNWINSPEKQEVTDSCPGCACGGSGGSSVFIPASMEWFSPEHFHCLQCCWRYLQWFFCLSKSLPARWLISYFTCVFPKHL